VPPAPAVPAQQAALKGASDLRPAKRGRGRGLHPGPLRQYQSLCWRDRKRLRRLRWNSRKVPTLM
jgi:hypothetical protein